MNGGTPPKHEIDVPQVRDTALFREIQPEIGLAKDIPILITSVESTAQEEYHLSDAVLDDIIYEGTSPKHEISVPWMDKYNISGKVSIDITDLQD